MTTCELAPVGWRDWGRSTVLGWGRTILWVSIVHVDHTLIAPNGLVGLLLLQSIQILLQNFPDWGKKLLLYKYQEIVITLIYLFLTSFQKIPMLLRGVLKRPFQCPLWHTPVRIHFLVLKEVNNIVSLSMAFIVLIRMRLGVFLLGSL